MFKCLGEREDYYDVLIVSYSSEGKGVTAIWLTTSYNFLNNDNGFLVCNYLGKLFTSAFCMVCSLTPDLC